VKLIVDHVSAAVDDIPDIEEKKMSRTPSASQSRSAVAGRRSGTGIEPRPTQDVLDYVRDYAREKPEVAALWCFGIGFILGWKLKPW
jgi:hypothetical protein